MCAARGVLAARGHFAAWWAIGYSMIEPYSYLHSEALAGHGVPQSHSAAGLCFRRCRSLVAAGTGHNVRSSAVRCSVVFALDAETQSRRRGLCLTRRICLSNDAAFPLVQFGISDWARVALKSLVPVNVGNLFRRETNAQVRRWVTMFTKLALNKHAYTFQNIKNYTYILSFCQCFHFYLFVYFRKDTIFMTLLYLSMGV